MKKSDKINKTMKKSEKLLLLIVFIVIVVCLLGIWRSLWIVLPTENSINLGNLFSELHAYSGGLTYSTTSITNEIATLLLQRATTSRTIARFCQIAGAAPTWIYKQGTSTNVVKNMGFPIASSTGDALNYDNCMTIDASDPYTGQVWGFSSATTTISVEAKQE